MKDLVGHFDLRHAMRPALAVVFSLVLARTSWAQSPAPSCSALPPGAQMMGSIEDSALGEHWVLLRDPRHPGGPGRLEVVPGPVGGGALTVAKSGRHSGPGALPAASRPVIYAGDHLLVEETTALIEARLEAVALEPASPGSLFRVRLKVGQAPARAIALGRGLATLAPVGEVLP